MMVEEEPQGKSIYKIAGQGLLLIEFDERLMIWSWQMVVRQSS